MEIHKFLQEEMTLAQAYQEKYANVHRNLALVYKIGDLVWLSTRNLKTNRLSKKLDAKYIGPFKITKVVNRVAYRL